MKKMLSFALLLMSLMVFNSCDEDMEMEMLLDNYEWIVRESTDWNIYQSGDSFLFYHDGSFETYGRRLHEYGYWRVKNGRLLIRFEGSPRNVDIEAALPVVYDDYVRLDCIDYMYETTYSLRLSRGDILEGYGYGHYYTKQK